MTEQSSVINANLDNNQNNLVKTNQNVEQTNENAEVLTEAPVVEAPVAEAPIVEAPVAEAPVAEAPVTEATSEIQTPAPQPAQRTRQDIPIAVLSKLKEVYDTNGVIQAKVEDRVRGGLRMSFEGAPLFLPTSHFSLKSNPTEEELIQSVGAVLNVEILEINEDAPSHKRNIIVSSKNLLEKKFWDEIKEGQIIEGPVTSITTFGIFIDIGGFEGLVHISRMSRKRVDSTKTFCKKGDKFKAVVVDVDKSKKRIGLSLADLEPSLFENVADKYPLNSVHKAVVKRFVDFGAFVELEDGIQGIIRNPDLSWTRRVNNPKDILSLEQEIDVHVSAINPDKELLTLSYKLTQPNPWPEIEKELKIGEEKTATVVFVKPEGAILAINDVDGFMPKSKMGPLGKGKKVPFKKGEQVEVVITDLVASSQSLILEPKDVPTPKANDRDDRGNRGRRNWDDRPTSIPQIQPSSNEVANFAFSDMLGEDTLKKLIGE